MSKTRAWLACWLFLFGGEAGAEPALGAAVRGLDDPALERCLERSLPPPSLRQEVEMRVFDFTGSETRSTADFLWKRGEDGRARLLLRVTEPPLRAGIAVLALERGREEPDLYLYLPELRQTRRVTGRTFSGSLLGTDFSYEDYLQFQALMGTSTVRRLDDATRDGRAVLVLEILPDQQASTYSRVLLEIELERCVPVRGEFFGRDGRPAKLLEVDLERLFEAGERMLPQRLIMHDLRQESRTELLIRRIEPEAPIADGVFVPAALSHVK